MDMIRWSDLVQKIGSTRPNTLALDKIHKNCRAWIDCDSDAQAIILSPGWLGDQGRQDCLGRIFFAMIMSSFKKVVYNSTSSDPRYADDIVVMEYTRQWGFMEPRWHHTNEEPSTHCNALIIGLAIEISGYRGSVMDFANKEFAKEGCSDNGGDWPVPRPTRHELRLEEDSMQQRANTALMQECLRILSTEFQGAETDNRITRVYSL